VTTVVRPEVVVLDETDSTNAEARRRAEAGATGPLWIAARRQTAGRGRRGRKWTTGLGNLAATLLMTTGRTPADAARIAYVAALAVADTFDAWVPPSVVAIKWPNDVLLDGRKAAGILVESGARVGGGLWLAVGCGLNLVSAPADVERPAARVVEHLCDDRSAAPSVEEALSTLADAFDRRLDQWDREGFDPIRQAWTERAVGMGARCVARLGEETVGGVAERLDPDGALVLRTPDGELRRITAGDVFFGPG
jgi:BirA family biotin operon repressor/biotin-[acetyl-CoA-carboxylase] ligase